MAPKSFPIIMACLFCALLASIFFGDLEKHAAASLSSIPEGGAEDASLTHLRQHNRRAFDAVLVAALVDPMAALLLLHSSGSSSSSNSSSRFDELMFAPTEAAHKSPYTLAKVLVAPGSLASQYLYNFHDTDPMAVTAFTLAFLLKDLIYWFQLFALVGITARVSWNKSHLLHHGQGAIAHMVGDAIKAEAKALLSFLLMRATTMALALMLGTLEYVAHFMLPVALLDFAFGARVIMQLLFTLNLAAHLCGMDFICAVLDPITLFVVSQFHGSLLLWAITLQATEAADHELGVVLAAGSSAALLQAPDGQLAGAARVSTATLAAALEGTAQRAMHELGAFTGVEPQAQLLRERR